MIYRVTLIVVSERLDLIEQSPSGASRRAERHRVALTVRYGTARDFVVDYAENLSAGGLFVRGSQPFERDELVDIMLELPGYGEFEVRARAAHSITPELAAQLGRSSGTGFSIIEGPTGFFDALHRYLIRLGLRREHTVLVKDETLQKDLDDAGYLIAPVPPPGTLFKVIALIEDPVIAVIVPSGHMKVYIQAASSMGTPELIKVAEHFESFEALLMALDEELF